MTPEHVQSALDAVNPELPHYKQVRAFCVREEAFSIESGMLTVNGKLKRDVIAARMKNRDRGDVPGEAGGVSRAGMLGTTKDIKVHEGKAESQLRVRARGALCPGLLPAA